MPQNFRLTDYQYAHRGLWSDHLPENSSAAFRAAAENGFGIECDVHLSLDNIPFVFHDFTLERLTRDARLIGKVLAEELKSIGLAHTNETIPTLAEVLEIMGQTPILIELKCDDTTNRDDLASAVFELTNSHTGPFAIMSFDHLLLAKVRELSTDIMLGGLIDPRQELDVEHLIEFIAYNRIDYLGPNIKDVGLISDISDMLDLQTATWTVRTEDDLKMARKNKAAPIFEKLDPALVRQLSSS